MESSRIISEISSDDASSVSKEEFWTKEHVYGIAMSVSIGIIILTFLITLVVYWLLIKFNTGKEGMNRLILCLISMAVGALLGDAVLNLIPEIFSSHTDSHGEVRDKGNPIISSTIIIASYVGYFILEKIVKLLRNNNQQYLFKTDDKNIGDKIIGPGEILTEQKELPGKSKFSKNYILKRSDRKFKSNRRVQN